MRRTGQQDEITAKDPLVGGRNRIASETASAGRRANVAATRQLASQCRAGVRAGEARYPAGDWAAREREAIDALRVVTVFLENHPSDPVAQAFAEQLSSEASGLRDA